MIVDVQSVQDDVYDLRDWIVAELARREWGAMLIELARRIDDLEDQVRDLRNESVEWKLQVRDLRNELQRAP